MSRSAAGTALPEADGHRGPKPANAASATLTPKTAGTLGGHKNPRPL
ncbi:hypothetical protein BN903_20 [Halorubrum sp. AJ67]|nr:hypothetical protein BN903_20 [Halorubrum sp. AJ67]